MNIGNCLKFNVWCFFILYLLYKYIKKLIKNIYVYVLLKSVVFWEFGIDCYECVKNVLDMIVEIMCCFLNCI